MTAQNAQDLLQNTTPSASAAGARSESSSQVDSIDNIQLALDDPKQHQALLQQATCNAIAELFALFKRQFPQPASTKNALDSLKAFFQTAAAHLDHLNLLVNALASLKPATGASAEDKFTTTPRKSAVAASSPGPTASSAASPTVSASPAASASPSQKAKRTVTELKFYSFYDVLSYTRFNIDAALALWINSPRKKIGLQKYTRILFESSLYSAISFFVDAFAFSKKLALPDELEIAWGVDVYVSLYGELNTMLTQISAITTSQLAEQSLAPLTSCLTIFRQLALVMPHSEVLVLGETDFFFLEDEPSSNTTAQTKPSEQKHTKSPGQFQTPLPGKASSSLSLAASPASARIGDMSSPASADRKGNMTSPAGNMTSPASRSDGADEEVDPKDKDDKQLIDKIASHATEVLGTLLLSPDNLPAGAVFNSSTFPLIPGKEIHPQIANILQKLSTIMVWHGIYKRYQSNPTLSSENYMQLLATPPSKELQAISGDIKNHLHDKFVGGARQAAFLADPKTAADFFAKLYCEVCCALDANYTKGKSALNSFTEDFFRQLTACFESWPKVQERVFPGNLKKQGNLVKPSQIQAAMASGKKPAAASQYAGSILRTGASAGVSSLSSTTPPTTQKQTKPAQAAALSLSGPGAK